MSESIINLKIRNTCRICLFTTDNIEEFVFLNEDNVWPERFQFCFGIKLNAQDQQQVLCLMCSIDIKKFICFKEKCLQSHRLWQSLMSDVRCNIIRIDCVNNINEDAIDNIIIKEVKSENLDTWSDNDQSLRDNDNTNDFTEMKMEYNENKLREQAADDIVEKELQDKCDERLNNLQKIKTKAFQNSQSNESAEIEREKIFSCKRCRKKYIQWGGYLKHINSCQLKRPTENQQKRWTTPDYVYNCGKKYDGKNTVKKENAKNICTETKSSLTKIQNNSPFSCGLCSNGFECIQVLIKHLNEHWDNNDLACQLCDFVGVDLAAIAAHRYYHYPREGRVQYFCHICRNNFLSLMSLHFHYRKIHLGKAGGYCAQCNKEFLGLTLWKKHERKKHSAPKYICDICGKRYVFKYYLKDHMMNSHLGIKQHICDICGKCFKSKTYLKLHRNVVHTKAEPLKCTHCNKMFKSYHTLQVHHKIISMGKNYKCEVCHKTFLNSNNLDMHMIMHSDERPFSCDICGVSYKYKAQIKVHMVRHSGFLPHKCFQCAKTFATTSQLKRHSSVHTGVRRHACIAKNCVKSFHSRKVMLAHLQSQHKNENAEPK